MPPAVSVVIATDYFGTEEPCWDDVIGCARALAAQDFDGPVEYRLPETRTLVPRLPRELETILPGLRILPVDSDASYDFKNAGVEAASSEIVAMLDADCIPAEDWLRSLVDTMRTQPEVAVVSGRTRYAGDMLLQRLLNPLDRMFVDRKEEGPVSRISNNNAGYRRDAYLAHPLSNASGPFGGMLQVHAMLQNGYVLYFQPAIHLQV